MFCFCLWNRGKNKVKFLQDVYPISTNLPAVFEDLNPFDDVVDTRVANAPKYEDYLPWAKSKRPRHKHQYVIGYRAHKIESFPHSLLFTSGCLS